MGNIVLLDDLTINQIAAGEVIERPANVVKELVENSIDAGATAITIEIKDGGKSFIKIIDNGKGIEPDDIAISLERHATSKIRKVEDLEQTYTMGFRGEALASISAISNLTMITKTKEQDSGIKLMASGGNIISYEEIACQNGTTILVENLFFNTPVRYKFLKQDFTEFKYIKDWVQKIAMANLNVSFKLINEGKIVFKSNGNGKLDDIIYLLYGKNIQSNLFDVDYEESNIKVTGKIGNSYVAEKTRKNQILFLNKRNIKNSVLMNSGDQAFVGSIGIGKYGFYILNLEMPASFYDVNVHPTKMEVRFKDEELVYQVLYKAIKGAILNKSFLGNEETSSKQENYVSDEYKFTTDYFENKKLGTKIVENEKYSNELIKRENKRNVDYKFIGISFKTYIIVEIDNEIHLIDQHAAHERLLYEQIKNNYKNNIHSNSQMLLLPEVIDLQHNEMDFVRNNLDLIKKIGYDIEFFGDNSIKINGTPDIEYRSKTNIKNMFLDILDEMITNSKSPIKDIEERFIATVACKAAVKAGMDLTKQEVDYLIQNLLTLQNPYTCPHGRPTTVKFAKNGDITIQ